MSVEIKESWDFHKIYKKYHERSGISFTFIARRLRSTPQYIYRWTKDRCPKYTDLLSVIKLYHLNEEEESELIKSYIYTKSSEDIRLAMTRVWKIEGKAMV